MTVGKQNRILEIFFRGMRGEILSIAELACEYGVSKKSISRDVGDLKAFLADRRELVGNTSLKYDYQLKGYRLCFDDLLSNTELFALAKLIIGTKAFSKIKLLELVNKLVRFTTPTERPRLRQMLRREMYHYTEVSHESGEVENVLWQLVCAITDRREISIDYSLPDRTTETSRLYPASVLFSDMYFYLIAFGIDDKERKPMYFRADLIRKLTVHRKRVSETVWPSFDEGLLRKRSLLMWGGQLRTVRFEFSGPSVQTVLDRLPTAKIIEKRHGTYLLEAEAYGDGIKMWLLSQGRRTRVVGPPEFVEEMRGEVEAMRGLYEDKG